MKLKRPRIVTPPEAATILDMHRRHHTPERIARSTGRARSTVQAVIKRGGASPLAVSLAESDNPPTKVPWYTRLGKWLTGLFATLLMLSVAAAASGQEPTPTPAPPVPPIGTMLATRNAGGEDANRSPGHWNHLAVMGPNEYVIEAQAEAGVVATPWSTFYHRYALIVAFQPDAYPPALGEKVAIAALSRLGEPYSRIGGNCVVLVRASVEHVTRKRPHWRRPDHAVPRQVEHGLGSGTVLWQKNDPSVVPPEGAAWFAGATRNPTVVLGAVQ